MAIEEFQKAGDRRMIDAEFHGSSNNTIAKLEVRRGKAVKATIENDLAWETYVQISGGDFFKIDHDYDVVGTVGERKVLGLIRIPDLPTSVRVLKISPGLNRLNGPVSIEVGNEGNPFIADGTFICSYKIDKSEKNLCNIANCVENYGVKEDVSKGYTVITLKQEQLDMVQVADAVRRNLASDINLTQSGQIVYSVQADKKEGLCERLGKDLAGLDMFKDLGITILDPSLTFRVTDEDRIAIRKHDSDIQIETKRLENEIEIRLSDIDIEKDRAKMKLEKKRLELEKERKEIIEKMDSEE